MLIYIKDLYGNNIDRVDTPYLFSCPTGKRLSKWGGSGYVRVWRKLLR